MKIHFVVGKKDGDIGYWMESLENGLFSNCVVAILDAELREKIARIPVPKQKGRVSKKIDTSIYVSDENILEMLRKIPQGKRSKYIRSIIRKHLAVNYKKSQQQGQTFKRKEDIPKEKVNIEPTVVASAVEENVPVQQSNVQNTKEETAKEEVPVNDFRAKMMRMTNR